MQARLCTRDGDHADGLSVHIGALGHDMTQEIRGPAGSGQTSPGTDGTSSAIELSEVRHYFGDLLVLDGIDLSVPSRSRVSFVGPSGCGKSTLLLMIAGLLNPQGGTITVGEAAEPSRRLRRCALMPQQDLLLPWRTALDNACLALENRGVSRSAARKQAQPLFDHFGLASFEQSYPSQLSGGMRQRVSFLRTLMADKAVFLLDEPFGALDAISRAAMQEWLLSAMAEVPKTIMLVTHDVEEALLLANTVVVFSSRPARILDVIDVKLPARENRLEAVSDPEFVALKHRALGAIR
jgi:ABC-type nitrate/sulfonate/bicarbonate transport system ATPase subunit